MSRDIVVVTAGLSEPSSSRLLADLVGDAVAAAVGGRGEQARVSVIEVRELAAELATAATTGGLAGPGLAAARERVLAADGLIVVTPVFNGSYSGLFKMFFDDLSWTDPQALDGVPVLIAATAGTPRHSLVLDHALRPLFSYLRAVVVPTGVFAATADFGDGDAAGLTERIGRAASQFAALVVGATVSVGGFAPNPTDRHDGTTALTVTPFSTLLRGRTG